MKVIRGKCYVFGITEEDGITKMYSGDYKTINIGNSPEKVEQKLPNENDIIK